MFIKLEVYHSSTISDYTTNNFYSLRRFNRHRRPSSATECSVVTASEMARGEQTVPHVTL